MRIDSQKHSTTKPIEQSNTAAQVLRIERWATSWDSHRCQTESQEYRLDDFENKNISYQNRKKMAKTKKKPTVKRSFFAVFFHQMIINPFSKRLFWRQNNTIGMTNVSWFLQKQQQQQRFRFLFGPGENFIKQKTRKNIIKPKSLSIFIIWNHFLIISYSIMIENWNDYSID
jgi:hypothetical protein